MVEVNGREVKFKYSVGACIELARLCPEGDITNLMAYLNDSEAGRRAENRMRFVCILSLMGEKAAAFEAPGYKPTPLTYDEVASLTPVAFAGDTFFLISLPDKHGRRNRYNLIIFTHFRSF